MNVPNDAYCCPFCSLVVDQETPRARLALVAFEQHLDVHMARRDTLPARPAAA